VARDGIEPPPASSGLRSPDTGLTKNAPCECAEEKAYTIAVKFRVVLEYDSVAQIWSAVCPELPGCASAGETEAEARQYIEDAIRLYLSPSDLDLPDHAKFCPELKIR